MDTFQGSLLGQHGLAYTLLVFSSNSMARRITLFGGRGQVVYILLLLVAAEVLVLIAVMAVGIHFPGWWFFVPAVTGALIWPIFKVCLTKLTANRKNS